MGRRKLESRKINKSGRFDPDLLDRITTLSDEMNLNFSQTLEFLSDLGVNATADGLYDKIRQTALSEGTTYQAKIRETLEKEFLS